MKKILMRSPLHDFFIINKIYTMYICCENKKIKKLSDVFGWKK